MIDLPPIPAAVWDALMGCTVHVGVPVDDEWSQCRACGDLFKSDGPDTIRVRRPGREANEQETA